MNTYPLPLPIRTAKKRAPLTPPLIRTCAYQEKKMFVFLENLACFVFLKHSF